MSKLSELIKKLTFKHFGESHELPFNPKEPIKPKEPKPPIPVPPPIKPSAEKK